MATMADVPCRIGDTVKLYRKPLAKEVSGVSAAACGAGFITIRNGDSQTRFNVSGRIY